MNWSAYASDTSNVVVQLFRENHSLLAEAAGAVLAIHQDTLMAFGVDMNRTDDAIWNATIDRMSPHKLGKFPDRVMIVMEMLPNIDNAWLDAIGSDRPAGMTKDTWVAHKLMARFRSNAARTWLMTIMSKQDTDAGRQVRLGTETIWLALASVQRDVAVEHAAEYVGTFYEGIKTTDINPRAWPQLPDVVISTSAF